MVVVDEARVPPPARLPSPCTGPVLRGCRATSPGRSRIARRALELVAEDDHSAAEAAAAAPRPRLLDATAIWRRRPVVSEAMASLREGRAPLRRRRWLDRPGRHPDRAGPTRRCDGARTSGPCSWRRSQGGPVARGSGGHARRHERSCSASAMTCDGATQHLRPEPGAGRENGLPQNPYRSRVAAARIRQAEGDSTGRSQLLDEAERLYFGDFSPDVRPVAAVRARVLDRAGAAHRTHSAGRASGPSHGRGRPDLPPRVRAHDPGAIAPRPGRREPTRRAHPRGDRAVGAAR